jgi:hypothetical protein
VMYALDELSGPPPELWDELGFDGADLPTARAAALGLTVRQARPAPAFESFPYRPAVEIFARLTGHEYDQEDQLHATQLRVLEPARKAVAGVQQSPR